MLQIGPGIKLPLDFATEAWAVLARRGAGKSNAGAVMVEELYRNHLPFVVLDPKGDWWGIRSSADGKSDGLAIPVFGGRRGDVPLEPGAGHLIADLVLGDQSSYLSCVLDVSLFSISEQRRFLRDFLDRLFRHKDEQGVLTLIFEEAHEYLPQVVPRESRELVSVAQRIVKQGRQRGLGVGMLSQRSAALNKDVLTQIGALIPMWIMSPQDRAAIKAWVEVGGDANELINSLHTLKPGEAWLWWPEGNKVQQRITFRRRWTFDSGATPKAGQKRLMPRTIADVDLGAIKDSMTETIEKAKAEDPKELRKKIRELEQQKSELEKAMTELQPIMEPEIVFRPVLTDEDREETRRLANVLDVLTGDAAVHVQTLRNALALAIDLERTAGVTPAPRPKPVQAPYPKPSPPAPSTRPSMRPPTDRAGGDPDEKLSKAERAILTVLAQHGTRNVIQTALQARYSHKGGGYRNSLSSLRTKGYIEGRGDLTITSAGLDVLGDYEPLPTGRALAEWWKQNQLSKAERAILDVLLEAYPASVSIVEIAERAGYEPGGGGFRNSLSKLRSLELAEGRGEMRLKPELAE